MGTLYFSPPDKLNDPFDCNINVKQSILNAAKELTGINAAKLNDLAEDNKLFDKLNTDINELGVCAFSLDLLNTIMWSHYANDHKGVSILYDFPESFITDECNKLLGVATVNYEPDSLMNWFKCIANQIPDELNFEDFVIKLAQRIVTVKSPAWKDENEVRILRTEIGTLKIPRSFIKQICFGLRTPKQDIELVSKITEGFKHKVQLCKIEKSVDSDFSIYANEI